MRKQYIIATLIVTAICSAADGYFAAHIQHEEQALADRRENYTDRGRICIEAASMIRNGDVEDARKFLEGKAIHALRGVPMGADYADLLPKSQALLVRPRRYENTFPESKLDVERLANDVPDDHPMISLAVRSATSPAH